MCCMHRNGLAGVIVTDSATERTKGGILEMPSVTEREADMQNKYGRRVAASGSFGGSGIGARESSVISHSPRWHRITSLLTSLPATSSFVGGGTSSETQ